MDNVLGRGNKKKLHLAGTGSWTRARKLIFVRAKQKPLWRTLFFFGSFFLFSRNALMVQKFLSLEKNLASRTSCTCLCKFRGTSPAGWVLSGPADTEPLAATGQTEQTWAIFKRRLSSIAMLRGTLPRWCRCRWCRICLWSSWFVPRSPWQISWSPTGEGT